MKTCSKCKLSKSLDDFHKSKRLSQGRRSWCKVCERDRHTEWVEANPEKIAAIDKRYLQNNKDAKNIKIKEWCKRNPDKVKAKRDRWKNNNPDKVKSSALKSNYGIDLQTYNIMFISQGGCCAICKTHQDKLKVPLCVDHCHTTGKVRGLLCKRCNSGIGFLNDDKQLVANALKYLHETE